MAVGIVWVTPGMLPTKVMVAPNSPSARAKQSTMPAMMPGSISGSVMVRTTMERLPPSVAAAASSRRSTASSDKRMARTMSGSPMIAAASAAPVQRNAKTIPKARSKNSPAGPLRPKARRGGEPETTGGITTARGRGRTGEGGAKGGGDGDPEGQPYRRPLRRVERVEHRRQGYSVGRRDDQTNRVGCGTAQLQGEGIWADGEFHALPDPGTLH